MRVEAAGIETTDPEAAHPMRCKRVLLSGVAFGGTVPEPRSVEPQPKTCFRQPNPRQPKPGGGLDVCWIEQPCPPNRPRDPERPPRDAALETLAVSAASNIPGVDFVSITVHRHDQSMSTEAATDPLAEQADVLQYELRKGRATPRSPTSASCWSTTWRPRWTSPAMGPRR